MAAVLGSSPATTSVSIQHIPETFRQLAIIFSEESSQRDAVDEKIKALTGNVMKSHPQHLAVDSLDSLLKKFSSMNNASKTIEAKVETIREMATLIEKIAKPLGIDPRLAALSRTAGSSTRQPRRSRIELPPSLSRSPSLIVTSSGMTKQDAKIAELTSQIEQLKEENAEQNGLIHLLKSQQNEINNNFEMEISQLKEDIANLSMLLQLKLGVSVQKEEATSV